MNEHINKLAEFGIEGVILPVVITTNHPITIALTVAFARLTGLFDPLGSQIRLHKIISTAIPPINEYGIEYVAINVIKKLIEQGKTKSQIIKEIDKCWTTKKLKTQIKDYVNQI